MPAKSKSQIRFLFAKEGRGELPEGTAREFAHKSKGKKLPNKVSKKSKKHRKSKRS